MLLIGNRPIFAALFLAVCSFLFLGCSGALQPKADAAAACSSMPSGSAKNSCFEQLFLGQVDLGMCANISGEPFSSQCYEKFAEETKNISVCDLISTDAMLGSTPKRDFCYWQVAEAAGDVSMCNRIPYPVSVIHGCYMDVAVKTANATICELISGPGSSWVQETCYFQVASIREDTSICDKVSEQSRKSCVQSAIQGNFHS